MTIAQQPVGGVYLPLVTPFANGEIDEKSLTRLLDRYRHTGISGVVLAATTGESPVLSAREVELLVEKAAHELAGELPIYLGVSGNDTSAVAADIARHDRLHVDGYLVTAPYYNRPSQAGLSAHFDAVAGETDRAVIVYNIPYRTGVNLENATLLSLAERHSNIVGVKDSSGDIKQSLQLIREGAGRLAVLTGEDHLFFMSVALGGAGGILAASHVLPEHFVSVFRDLRGGHLEEALDTWNRLSPWIPLLFEEPNPVPLKAWLAAQDLIASPECRLPLTPATPATLEALRQRLPRDTTL